METKITSQQSIALSQSRGYSLTPKAPSMEKIEATAKEFEAQFISQMLDTMFSTLDPEESLGGSEEEETYQSFLIQEYGKVIERTGGIGLADHIKRAMLNLQEVETPHAPKRSS